MPKHFPKKIKEDLKRLSEGLTEYGRSLIGTLLEKIEAWEKREGRKRCR